MSDEATFLATLRANPTDATARGVYADWLDEQARPIDAARMRVLADPASDARRLEFACACEAAGERERGEFVRVQVELAKTPEFVRLPKGSLVFRNEDGKLEPYLGERKERLISSYILEHDLAVNNPRLRQLRPRERELWDRANDWFPTAGLEWLSLHRLTIRREVWELFRGDGAGREDYARLGLASRGFVSWVTCTAEDWLKHGDAIREQHPIERVKLTIRPYINRIYQDGMASVRLDARGDYKDYPQDITDDAVLLDLLVTEFPGIAFELPPN